MVSLRTTTTTIAAVMLLTAITSCSRLTGGPDVDPLTELRGRTIYEDAIATYTQMQHEMRQAVAGAVPSVTWQPDRSPLSGNCREPFSKLGGTSTGLQSWYAPGAVPDDTWPSAVRAARGVAERYGLTSVTTVVDRPADHQVRFSNPSDGAYTDLGTGVNTVLNTITGCNLPASMRASQPPSS